MARVNLDNLRVSDAVRRRNPSLFLPEKCWREEATERRPAPARNPLGSQARRRDALNKTEARFLDWLERNAKGEDDLLVVQPPRLFELEGGGTYTPDFILLTHTGLVVYEVKGGYRGPGWEQGIERYKRAAAQYAGRRVRFILANWDRRAMRWDINEWRTDE